MGKEARVTPSKADRAAEFINGAGLNFKVELIAGRYFLLRPGDLGRYIMRQEIIKLATTSGWKDGEE
jgi:hypothetical protein